MSFKIALITGLLFFSTLGQAQSSGFSDITSAQNVLISAQIADGQAFRWNVGDTGTYQLKIGSFMNGTAIMTVREIGADGVWVNQDAKVAGQSQKGETLFDFKTGAVKRMIMNGEEQPVAPPEDVVIDSMKQEKIKVPAGTFDSTHAVIKNIKNGEITEAWINPELIPIAGSLKLISPTKFGKMNLELVSFKFAAKIARESAE